MSDFRKIATEGLWRRNVVFAQMLSLCPLMAVTDTATNGMGMGIAAGAVLAASGLTVSFWRFFIATEIRLPALVMIFATLVTLLDLAMNAWLHPLHKSLGLFIPLIVVNCAILGRAEAFASHQPMLPAVLDGLSTGLGFLFALTLLGAIREMLGSGTLFANASLLLGKPFSFLEMKLVPEYKGFLLFILPPGGFLVVGFLVAAKRRIDARRAVPAPTVAPAPAQPSTEAGTA